MSFDLRFSPKASSQIKELEDDISKKRILKDVRKALALMQTNLRHPSLNTHEYHNIKCPHGQKMFESYAQQKTSGAYRIFWCYGPDKNILSIIFIIPHP
jgi:mRNA-degrading endonuclease RelE of RelBE toxin-antitoxin system